MGVDEGYSFLKSTYRRRHRLLGRTCAAIILLGCKVCTADDILVKGGEVQSADPYTAVMEATATVIPSVESHDDDNHRPCPPSGDCYVWISSSPTEQEKDMVADATVLDESPKDIMSLEGTEDKSNRGLDEGAAIVEGQDSNLAACRTSDGKDGVSKDSLPNDNGEDQDIGKYKSSERPDDSVAQSVREVPVTSVETCLSTLTGEDGYGSEPDAVPGTTLEGQIWNGAEDSEVEKASLVELGAQQRTVGVARAWGVDDESSVAHEELDAEATSPHSSTESYDVAPYVLKTNDDPVLENRASTAHERQVFASDGLRAASTVPVVVENSRESGIAQGDEVNSDTSSPGVSTATLPGEIDYHTSPDARLSASTVDSAEPGVQRPDDRQLNRGEGWHMDTERSIPSVDGQGSGMASVSRGLGTVDEWGDVSPETYLATHVQWMETELLKKLREEPDVRSLLDIWVERAREFILTRTVPPTDAQCDFSWSRLRCEPKCECGARLRFGDYTPGRACRLLHAWERSPSCETTRDPSDEPALARLVTAARSALSAARRVYETRVAPPTDDECSFSFQTGRCEPRGLCRLRWRFGDVTLSGACRLSDH